MRSPFSDFTATDSERYVSASTALEFESPFLDPGQMEFQKEHGETETFSYESLIKEENETAVIDFEKAARLNKKYEAELWGSQMASILKYFSSIGIFKNAVPVDAGKFALAVAKWQETVFKNKKDVDGVLGPQFLEFIKATSYYETNCHTACSAGSATFPLASVHQRHGALPVRSFSTRRRNL